MSGALAALALALTVISCADAPRVTSCADSLTGVWRPDSDDLDARSASGEVLAFHIVDDGELVAVYPMFDDSHPPGSDKLASPVSYAPGMMVIERISGRRGQVLALTGERVARVTRGATTCTLSAQATIRACDDDTLELSWLGHRHIDWDTCQSIRDPRFRRVQLRRTRR